MPKFPTDDHTSITTTEFPKTWSKDVRMQARIVEEQWRRVFPLIPYYSLKKAVTPRADIEDFDELVGEDSTTKFDTLWREGVPTTSGTWKQPHLSGDLNATERHLFEESISMHMKLIMEGTEHELKRFGFDKVKDIVAQVPMIFFDRFNRKPQEGDKFFWDGDMFVVLQTKRHMYWKNTNIRMYYVLNCERKRRGS